MSNRGIIVFSGGTAANSLVDVFASLAKEQNYHLSYIIPICDNGGSSSEITRVLGGPGIGDIRSRLVRLIPEVDKSAQNAALKELFSHRLPTDPSTARSEWHEIIEGQHSLWQHIPSEQRELIRPFLNLVNLEISKRARPSNAFGFQQAALGNLFLTGARLFTGSLESAICLLKAIAGIGAGVDVLPIVNTNHTVHIAATLADGSVVIGQNAISHPWAAPAPDDDADDPVALPGSLPALRRQNISYSTQTGEVPPLPTHVRKIWYVNPYGHEIHPAANPKALEAIRSARLVIYSIGSLYTSIVPCLIVKGVGQALMTTKSTAKVLMMNRAVDREISRGPHDEPMNYRQIVEALLQAAGAPVETLEDSAAVNPMVTHILYIRPRRPKEGSIALDRVPDGTPEKSLDAVFEWRYSVMVWGVAGRRDETGEWSYEPEALLQALEKIVEWQQKLEVESGEGEPGDLVV